MLQAHILIVEDEKTIADLMDFHLVRGGYQTTIVHSGEDAMRQFASSAPDLVLLDVMLPDRSGFDVCRWIRGRGATPVIMVTARGEEVDRVLGLEIGADDYVSKPFSPRELVARVKAVLRRVGDDLKTHGSLKADRFAIDIDAHEVRVQGGQVVPLTATEFAVLQCLTERQNLAVSRDALLDQVWGANFYGDTRTIDVHIRHLREKLEQYGCTPGLIETVRGIGYRLRSEPR